MNISNFGSGSGFSTSAGGMLTPPSLGIQPAAYLAALINRQRYFPGPAGFGVSRPSPASNVAPAENDSDNMGSEAATRAKVQDQLLQEELRQKKIEDQQLDAPAPTRTVSGPQIIPGKVMDPLAMSAIQRKAFMPGNDTMVGGGGRGGGGGEDPTAADDIDYQEAKERAAHMAALMGPSAGDVDASAWHQQDLIDAGVSPTQPKKQPPQGTVGG